MKAEDKIYKDKSRYLCGLQNSLGNLNFTMMRTFLFVAIFTIFSGIKAVQSQCLPGYYIVCSHNEAIRCNVNGNNRCECYCSQDSQCNNCPAGTLGFCINEKCVCETNNYCPGGNNFYCLKNFPCAHNESKRCNQNDRCECFCDIDTDCKNCLAGTLGFCVNKKCVCETNDYCPGGNKNIFYCFRNFQCSHNELRRCNQNERCECFCDIDTDCKNCPEKGFCVDGSCVCESQNYCPKGNHIYCLSLSCDRGYTSKCNSTNHCYCAYVPDTCSNNDVSKCYHLTCLPGEKKYCEGRTCTCKPLDYCRQNDGDCKNCPEKGFCVDGSCVCESQNYCPKGNHIYCLSLSCDRGYTSKCNSTNHCYCAYVPDTCSNHDVSTCYHLACSAGEKKYCEGRTCTCKPLDYCQQNNGDCQHKTCDASKAEINVCLSGTCGCLAIPDFCGGDDTSTCQHTICNRYQVKKCENGMCKCQVNPSCNSKEGLNDTCTPENTYLEVKGTDGKSYYANCNDSYPHFPLCVEDRCQCVYWKTPPPNFTSEGSTIPTNSMTNVSGSTVSSTVTSQTTEAMTDSSTPIPTDQPTGASQATTQAPVPSTTSAQTVSPTTTFSTSVDTTASTTYTTPLSTSHPPLTTTITTTTTTTTAAICASRMDCNQQNTHATFLSFTMPCPVDHIDCVNTMCFCSIDKITTTTRASSTTTTTPVPTTTKPTTTTPKTTTPVPTTTPVTTTTATTTTTPVSTTTATTTPATTPVQTTTPVPTTTSVQTTPVTTTTATTTTTPVPTTLTTTPTTTHQTSGCNKSGSKPCPSCDANLNCVWNQTCADSETCMVRGVLEHGFQFSVHCILSSDCHLMKFLSNYTAEIYCCDDQSCLQQYLGV